jgi:hypothetical protein
MLPFVSKCAAIKNAGELVNGRCGKVPDPRNRYFCKEHWLEACNGGVYAVSIRGMPGLPKNYNGDSYLIKLSVEKHKSEPKVEQKKIEPKVERKKIRFTEDIIDSPIAEGHSLPSFSEEEKVDKIDSEGDKIEEKQNEEVHAEVQCDTETIEELEVGETKAQADTSNGEDGEEPLEAIDVLAGAMQSISEKKEKVFKRKKVVKKNKKLKLKSVKKKENDSLKKDYIISKGEDKKLRIEYGRMEFAEVKIMTLDLNVYKDGMTKSEMIEAIMESFKEE